MSVAEQVRRYVRNNPYIKYCLQRDLVNYAKLARTICEEELDTNGSGSYKAAEVSLRRMSIKDGGSNDITEVIRESDIEIMNNIDIIIGSLSSTSFKQNIDTNKPFFLVEDQDLAIVLTKSTETKAVKKGFSSIYEKHEDTVMIKYGSSEDIEDVEGVVAHLTELLAEKGINIIEFISCYTKTYIVIDKKDLKKAIDVIEL